MSANIYKILDERRRGDKMQRAYSVMSGGAEAERAEELRKRIEQAAVSLPDEDALEAVELFQVWKPDTAYVAPVRVQYGGKLYRCEQSHTSQAGWEPPITPALWTEVAKPGEIPVWRQPTGAQDAYNSGDKVRYPDEDGDVWVSTVDANVWEPGVYGWEKEGGKCRTDSSGTG